MADKGAHPMKSLAWCACAEFGSKEEPRPLFSVLGHRRHRKHPECEQPPFILGDDGNPIRADYPVKSAAEAAAARAEKAAKKRAALEEEGAPLSPPPWHANGGAVPPGVVQQVPNIPMGPPPALTGKATMPAPDPKAGIATPAPMFTVSLRVSAGLAQLWDWTLQQGYAGTFEEWVDQAVKACYRDLVGIAPMIVPVEAVA